MYRQQLNEGGHRLMRPGDCSCHVSLLLEGSVILLAHFDCIALNAKCVSKVFGVQDMRKRDKTTKIQLTEIASSFHCYAEEDLV